MSPSARSPLSRWSHHVSTLDGKVVVITGAGSGIGRALAVAAARRGALLALSDVDENGVATTADLARDAGAREVRTDRLDVADRAAFGAYATAVAEHFGRVNVVVNNAGVALSGPVEEMTYEDMDWITGINFWGVVHGSREFLPHLIASGDGHLVNLSSIFGLAAIPTQAAYNATKYAVRGFSEALRMELMTAGHPVGLSVVHPGGIRTAIARNARVTAGESAEQTSRTFDEKLARTTPEQAAETIIAGMLRGKPRILVGADAHALHLFATTLGARYQDVVARAAARMLPDRQQVPR